MEAGSILKFGIFAAYLQGFSFVRREGFSDFTCKLSRRLEQKVAVARRTALLWRKPKFEISDLVEES